MLSYKTWKDSHYCNKRKLETHTNNTAISPWSAKLPRAVWRGATTCNKGLYGHLPLADTPRSKLVKRSLDRPDLIDAGFHKLVGKHEFAATNESGRMLKEAIPLEEMAMYKGE